ncbi:baseplate assembly protein W [Natronospirillum operosum]|uniref:Baseplate assembly protein W n=1 Tax=Natronospirillum operosum TaxID=2759953 RepID=A0A4Z0W627_9GAMM|nr:GPW/gp25 family protein [Natronospirillum operosum]TGG92540.1 baseplate assembly protein W [Natronospirillum operosum]
MRGTDRKTGKAIEGLEYLRQRIDDVLTTPIGTLLLRPEYGSGLFELVDDPVDERFRVEVTSAVANALNEHIEDFRLEGVRLAEMTPTGPVFDLVGVYLPDGRRVTLERV